MAAGGPGDHPLSDILDFKLVVYGEPCDNLIKEISKFVSRDELEILFDWFDKKYFKQPDRFAVELKAALEKYKLDRKQRGWEQV